MIISCHLFSLHPMWLKQFYGCCCTVQDLFLVLITRQYNAIQALHPPLKWILKYFTADYRLYIPMRSLESIAGHTGGSHKWGGMMVPQRWSQHPQGPKFIQVKLLGEGQRKVKCPRVGGIRMWYVMMMGPNSKVFFRWMPLVDAIGGAMQRLQCLC